MENKEIISWNCDGERRRCLRCNETITGGQDQDGVPCCVSCYNAYIMQNRTTLTNKSKMTTLKEIFQQYQIYNHKGELVSLFDSQLGKNLISDINQMHKQDAPVENTTIGEDFAKRYSEE